MTKGQVERNSKVSFKSNPKYHEGVIKMAWTKTLDTLSDNLAGEEKRLSPLPDSKKPSIEPINSTSDSSDSHQPNKTNSGDIGSVNEKPKHENSLNNDSSNATSDTSKSVYFILSETIYSKS